MAAHKRLPDAKHSRGWNIKDDRRYLLFSTDGVPSNLCVGLTFALLWCWFVQIVEPYFLKFGKSISFFLFYLISSSLEKVFLISWSMYKVCLSFLEGWVSLSLFMLANFFNKKTLMFNPLTIPRTKTWAHIQNASHCISWILFLFLVLKLEKKVKKTVKTKRGGVFPFSS